MAPKTKIKHGSIALNKFPGFFLLASLFGAAFFLYFVLKPFLGVFLLGAILASTCYPLYRWFLKLYRNRGGLAAFTTCLLIISFVIVPLMLFLSLLAKQGLDIYVFVEHKIQSGEFDNIVQWQKGNFVFDFFDPNNGQWGSYVDLQSFDFKQTIADSAKSVSAYLVSQSASLVKSLGGLAFGFFMLFFVMYYLFKDGTSIEKRIFDLVPLPNKYLLVLFNKFREISRVSLFGIFFTAIIQGTVGGIGFTIVGIPNPVFWGTAMGFFSLIPMVGTAIVWLPASLILLLSGNYYGGGFLLFWGLLLVSTVDNFFRAYFIGNHTKIHPLLAFSSVLGGIFLFGLAGVLFGPLILTIFFTLLHIYELEYKGLLKEGE